MNNRKPTWNYILNDIAFISLLTECLYSEYPSSQHKYDLEYQIKLIQDKLNKQKEVINKIKEYIKENTRYYDKELGLVEMMGAGETRTPVVYLYGLLELLEEIE